MDASISKAVWAECATELELGSSAEGKPLTSGARLAARVMRILERAEDGP